MNFDLILLSAVSQQEVWVILTCSLKRLERRVIEIPDQGTGMLGIAGIPGTTLFLAIVYLLLALLTTQRLLWLEANATRADIQVNTKKLFVMACLVVTVLRVVSFSSITALNSRYFTLAAQDDGAQTPRHLTDKINIVLFDLPDFFCVSAYVLLLVVWAEAYLKSRQHWLSTNSFRHYWMLGYAVFNVNLYAVQIALYSMMFVPSIDPSYLSVWIYAVLTAINLCLPLIWAVGFVYLTFTFSGFPLSSNASKLRLSILSYVGTVWTLSRLGWGLVTLSSALRVWLDNLGDRSSILYSVTVIALFLSAEVFPILLSLRESTIQSLAAAARAQSVSFGHGQSILAGYSLGDSRDSVEEGGYSPMSNYGTGSSDFQPRDNRDDSGRGLQLGPIAQSLGVVFSSPDPAYATPTAPLVRKHITVVRAIPNVLSDPSPGSKMQSPTRLNQQLSTPSPSALASLHHHQGKHLVGRPLSSAGSGSGSSSSGRPFAGRAIGPAVVRSTPHPRSATIAHPVNTDEEWSGDEDEAQQAAPRQQQLPIDGTPSVFLNWLQGSQGGGV